MMPHCHSKRCPNPPQATQQPLRDEQIISFGFETLFCVKNKNIITTDVRNFKPFSNNVGKFFEHEILTIYLKYFSLNFEP